MSEEQAFKYSSEAAAPRRKLAEKGRSAATGVGAWPEISLALDVVNLNLKYTQAELEEAADMAKSQWTGQQIAAAVNLLSAECDADGAADVTEQHDRAWAAASSYFQHANGELNDALGSARSMPEAKRPKVDGARPEVNWSALLRVISLQAKLKDENDANYKCRKELKRQSEEAAVLPPAPELAAPREEWATRGQTAAAQAKGILSAGGESFCGGKWAHGGSRPPESQRSRRLNEAQILDAMKPANGGGAIDAMLIEYDEETGEAMPCITHDGLSRMVKNSICEWSSDKAYGKAAYAYTSAFSEVLFAVSKDRRGMLRAETRTAEATAGKVREHATRLRNLAQGCRLALQTSDWDQLQRLATTAQAGHQTIPKAAKVAMAYLALPAVRQQRVQQIMEHYRAELPEQVQVQRAMREEEELEATAAKRKASEGEGDSNALAISAATAAAAAGTALASATATQIRSSKSERRRLSGLTRVETMTGRTATACKGWVRRSSCCGGTPLMKAARGCKASSWMRDLGLQWCAWPT